MQKWTDAQITPSPIGKTINNVSAINRNGELFSVQFVFGDNTTLTIDGHHNCSLWITHGGQPNDPSSPTAESNAQSAATALSAVGCSAWLGDYVRSGLNKIISESTKPGGPIYKYLNYGPSVSGNSTGR
jgi:hypothetical protein